MTPAKTFKTVLKDRNLDAIGRIEKLADLYELCVNGTKVEKIHPRIMEPFVVMERHIPTALQVLRQIQIEEQQYERLHGIDDSPLEVRIITVQP